MKELNGQYTKFIEEIKDTVLHARYKAIKAVNKELILLYYAIGKAILDKQTIERWGSKVIDQLSKDLRSAFPEMKGFSPRNLTYMCKFAKEYPDLEIVQEVLAQLTWYHNITLLEKVPNKEERLFYIAKAIEHGWSRNVMVMQIETSLYNRQGKAITNFKDRLVSPYSDLAHNTLKDPYIFDFLTIDEEAHEREIERSLISHMEKFLLELGEGFAFVGRQYHLHVGNNDFYIDLLFYHLKLNCFVVVELKTTEFKAEYSGKMNVYLAAVDDHLKRPTDNPSIGLILCKSKDNILAEYALRNLATPIGLAEYTFTKALPMEIQKSLPSIEELEDELAKNIGESKDE